MTRKNIISSQAIAKYVRISPTKVRRVINQVRGCNYENALILLEFLPYQACEPVWKVIKSAVANVRDLHDLNKNDNLLIDEVFVTPGPVLKRFRPRAQGRAYAIRKQTSHITVVIRVLN